MFEFDKIIQCFNQIVCLFGSKVINKPERILDVEYTKKGRIEHLFYAMSSVSVVFIEVKKNHIFGKGRLDIIGQVLTEYAGMSDFVLLQPPNLTT